MKRFTRDELLLIDLINSLKIDFNDRMNVTKNSIEITPQKKTFVGVSIISILILSPYLICLIGTKGNFISALFIWPVCLLFLVISIIIIITTDVLDNRVIFDLNKGLIIVENNSIWKKSKEGIKFAEIDCFKYTVKRLGKSTRIILSLKMNNGQSINIQEFSNASRASEILNYILKRYRKKENHT